VLAVDNLNGQNVCGREVMVDHVKQYKIPKQYMYLSDSQSENHSEFSDSDSKNQKKLDKKLFKPTGPDNRGWGDYRKNTNTEQIILEELE
jgi:hypothetical protein